ncbi:MAG: YHS domain-containing (seleno)protein [Myxococcota bacterium]
MKRRISRTPRRIFELMGAAALVVAAAMAVAPDAVRELPFPAIAEAQGGGGPYNRNGSRFAIGGYDPVAYFTDREPTRGSEAHQVRWGGHVWLFASAEHAEQFEASPRRYAPQYGGYCAYAMADGRAVRIDPNAWSIVGGKLYLNYSQDVRRRWNGDRAGYIARANEKWPEVRQSL